MPKIVNYGEFYKIKPEAVKLVIPDRSTLIEQTLVENAIIEK